MISTYLTTLVSYWTIIQQNSALCGHTPSSIVHGVVVVGAISLAFGQGLVTTSHTYIATSHFSHTIVIQAIKVCLTIILLSWHDWTFSCSICMIRSNIELILGNFFLISAQSCNPLSPHQRQLVFDVNLYYLV